MTHNEAEVSFPLRSWLGATETDTHEEGQGATAARTL